MNTLPNNFDSIEKYLQKVEIWNKASKGEVRFLVGPRSTLFMPLQDLGLVIIDEFQRKLELLPLLRVLLDRPGTEFVDQLAHVADRRLEDRRSFLGRRFGGVAVDAGLRPAFDALATFTETLAGIDRQLNAEFIRWDESHSPETLGQVRGLLNRRKYIHNLVRTVNQALAAA